jgi:hypothetical protein
VRTREDSLITRWRQLQILMGLGKGTLLAFRPKDPVDRLLGIYSNDWAKLQIFDTVRELVAKVRVEQHLSDRMYGEAITLLLLHDAKYADAISQASRMCGHATIPIFICETQLLLARAYLESAVPLGHAESYVNDAIRCVQTVCRLSQQYGLGALHVDALLLYAEVLLRKPDWEGARDYALAALHGAEMDGLHLVRLFAPGVDLFEYTIEGRKRSMLSCCHAESLYLWGAMNAFDVLGRAHMALAKRSPLSADEESAQFRKGLDYFKRCLRLLPETMVTRRQAIESLIGPEETLNQAATEG